jgi:hypothetical protein
VIDAQERKVGIDTYLLLNPPLDLNYALERVDEWNALGSKFGRTGSEALVARALAIVDGFSTESRDNPAVFDRLTREFATFTREEVQFLLAKACRRPCRSLCMSPRRSRTGMPSQLRGVKPDDAYRPRAA